MVFIDYKWANILEKLEKKWLVSQNREQTKMQLQLSFKELLSLSIRIVKTSTKSNHF